MAQYADFKSKVGLVTGAASGIGAAIAKRWATEGAYLILTDIKAESDFPLLKELKNMTRVSYLAGDVSSSAHAEALVSKARSEFGRLDFACNNAGISGEQAPLADMTVSGWQRTIDVNLSGVFYGMKYQIPEILRAGGGSIVNISSILGSVGFAGASAYVAAKHGVNGLTQTAAIEYSARGLRANAVGPAFINTPLLSVLDNVPGLREQVVSLHPQGRMGTAEEVAHLVTWLCSSEASFMSGAYVPIDGGYLSR